MYKRVLRSIQTPLGSGGILYFNDYASLPVMGDPKVIYIVKTDETHSGETSSYERTGTEYRYLSGGTEVDNQTLSYNVSTGDLSISNGSTVNLSFTRLPDVPDSYTGQAGKMVVVKSTEDGVEFTSFTNPLHIMGEIANADTNPAFPLLPADGDVWVITTTAGTVGGLPVEIGDWLVYTTVGGWFVLQSNLTQATETTVGYAKLATQPLTDAGTNDTTILTPLKYENSLQRKLLNAGSVTQPTITDNGTGLVDVSGITANFNTQSDFTGKFVQLAVPVKTGIQLVANQYTYVMADYNGGTPQYIVTTTNTTANHSTIINVVQLYREKLDAIDMVHIFYTGDYGLGLTNKIGHRLIHTERFGYESGLGLSEYGTRNVAIGDGKLWYDGQEISTLSVASATAGQEAHFYYHIAGVWHVQTATQYNNSQYDNGTALQSLTGSHYAVNRVYKCVNSTDRISYIVLGTGDYTINNAIASQPPAGLPDVITKQGILVGRIIVGNGNNTATQIDSAFSVKFATSGITDHATLTNLSYANSGHTGFEPTLTKGNLTESTSSILTIGNGTGSIIGSGTTITVQQADTTHSGYVSSTDWNTFNNKQPAGSYEVTSNKENTTIDTSTTKYPTVNLLKTGLDLKIPYTVATDTYFTTGIVDRTKSTISFNNTSKVFTISPTSGTFDIYLSAIKYAKGTSTVDLNTVGLVSNTEYFIYFDNTGTLKGSTTVWDIESNLCPVYTIYRNGSTGRKREERHGAVRNLAWHKWAHDNLLTQYKSGLDGTFTSNTTSIGSGVIEDEDISLPISTQTSVLIWYRNVGATVMTFDDTPVNYCAKIVGGVLKYDNGGTLTDVSSGYYIRNRVYATNDVDTPIYVVVGQNQYSNINDARGPELTVFPNKPTAEFRLLYRTIRQNVGGTPTFIESADLKGAKQLPSGNLAPITQFLSGLGDVSIINPSVDDLLAYNGVNWIPKTGSTVSGGNGVEFFNATPLLNTRTSPTGLSQDGTAGNGIQTATLSTTPVTTTEQTAVGINNGDTRPFSAWLGPVLNRTTLDAGTWDFTTFASVSSTANTPQIIRAVYQVVPGTGTLAFSGAGANTRTATISGGTPFQGTYYTANATNTVASWVQATSGTDKGMYQITATGSTSTATCTVRTGYTNESGVTYNVWNLLFTVSIPLTATTATKYDTTSTQSAFTVATTDRLGSMMFVTSTANARTVTVYYNGTTRNTHVLSPLKTLHNQLSGLQGGTSNEYYHMTSAQATVLSNTSGTNTGDSATNTTSNSYADGKVSDTAYGSGWDGVTGTAPSKNAVYDEIELHVGGNATKNIGYLNIPQNSQSANYTTVIGDAGKHIYHPSADTSARTITIDSNANVAYPIGTALTFVNDTSAGVMTIAITSDTMVLAGAGTTGSRTLAANGIATAVKITSTRRIISGNGLT